MCRQEPLQTLYNKVHVFSIQTQNKTKQRKQERKKNQNHFFNTQTVYHKTDSSLTLALILN